MIMTYHDSFHQPSCIQREGQSGMCPKSTTTSKVWRVAETAVRSWGRLVEKGPLVWTLMNGPLPQRKHLALARVSVHIRYTLIYIKINIYWVEIYSEYDIRLWVHSESMRELNPWTQSLLFVCLLYLSPTIVRLWSREDMVHWYIVYIFSLNYYI